MTMRVKFSGYVDNKIVRDGEEKYVFSKLTGYVQDVPDEFAKSLIENDSRFSQATEADEEQAKQDREVAEKAKASVPADAESESEEGATPGGSPSDTTSGGVGTTTVGGSTSGDPVV